LIGFPLPNCALRAWRGSFIELNHFVAIRVRANQHQEIFVQYKTNVFLFQIDLILEYHGPQVGRPHLIDPV
jgi:hypothetical protein